MQKETYIGCKLEAAVDFCEVHVCLNSKMALTNVKIQNKGVVTSNKLGGSSEMQQASAKRFGDTSRKP